MLLYFVHKLKEKNWFLCGKLKTVIIASKPICSKVQIQLYSQESKTVPRNPASKNLFKPPIVTALCSFLKLILCGTFRFFFLMSHDPVKEIQFPKVLTLLRMLCTH